MKLLLLSIFLLYLTIYSFPLKNLIKIFNNLHSLLMDLDLHLLENSVSCHDNRNHTTNIAGPLLRTGNIRLFCVHFIAIKSKIEAG